MADTQEPADRSHGKPIAVAIIGALALAATAVITGLFDSGGKSSATPSTTTAKTVSGGHSKNTDTCVGGGVIVEGDVNCDQSRKDPATNTEPTPTTADAGCGDVEGAPKEIKLRLHVVMWCAPEAVRGQYQYKLKVSVANTGNKPLDIRQQHFVLVWRTLNPSRWTPPAGGAPEPPRQIRYRNRRYWVIYANVNGVAEPRPKYGDLTFATHWGHTTLAPGRRSHQPGSRARKLRFQDLNGTIKTIRYTYHRDDLVFYVPRATVDRDRNFLGLAYLRGTRIVALCPQASWGPKVPPSVF